MTKEEAIKRIKDWNLDDDDKEVLSAAIPELKESEDDRIRKRIKNALIEWGEKCSFPGDVDDMLQWLEKQGKNDMGISEATKKKLEDNLNKALEKETPGSWNEFLEKQVEQKSTWCEEDEETIDRIYNFLWKNRKGDTSEIYQQEKDATWLKSLKERV